MVRLQRSVHRAGTLGDLLLPLSSTLFFLQLDGNQRGGVEAMGEGPSLPAAEGAPGPPSTFPNPPFFTRPVCPCGPVNAGRSCRRPPHAVYSLAQLNGSLSSGSAPFTTSDRKHCEGGARGTMQDVSFFRCLFMTALHFCSLLFLCCSLQAEASANQTTPTRLLRPTPTPRKFHALLTPPSPPIQLLSDPT